MKGDIVSMMLIETDWINTSNVEKGLKISVSNKCKWCAKKINKWNIKKPWWIYKSSMTLFRRTKKFFGWVNTNLLHIFLNLYNWVRGSMGKNHWEKNRNRMTIKIIIRNRKFGFFFPLGLMQAIGNTTKAY